MKGRFLVIAFIWIIIAIITALFFRFVIFPSQKKKEEAELINQKNNTIISTISDSRYKNVVNIGIDSFSGYAVFRSEDFINRCSSNGIKVNLIDDQGNYQKRITSLQKGDINFALFTVDTLIKSCHDINDLPGTIVLIIDETIGADAILAYKNIFPNIDSIKLKDFKIVVTKNSPHETLARVVLSGFGINCNDCWSFKENIDDVYKQYLAAKPSDNNIYVICEPYITKMRSNKDIIVLTDTSKFKGYIADVLVVSRDFLVKNEGVVEDIIKLYLSSLYSAKSLDKLILSDSIKTGQNFDELQSMDIMKKIWFKNTLENYEHFGFGQNKLQHVEDIISNITKILIKTGSISKDPTNNKPNYLYYANIVNNLSKSGFHPGDEFVREENVLSELSDEEWRKLIPVGSLATEEIVFARGTSTITESSEFALEELCKNLNSWSKYYLVIEGNVASRGNSEANKKLALDRANVIKDYLVAKGINPNRIKTSNDNPKNKSTVSFVLKQFPY